MFRILYFLGFILVSNVSHAWEVSSTVTIDELVLWQGANGNVLIKLSDDNKCYAPVSEKELYSLLLSLYMSGKKFTAYCHDTAETINGYENAHQIHRLNAF